MNRARSLNHLLAPCMASILLTMNLSAFAQDPHAPTPKAGASRVAAPNSMESLRGRWIRPDGGYGLVIRNVGTDGQLEAMYFNPKPLPFAKAQATRDGSTLRVFLELQAGGYNGSTYELTYDPGADRLKGVYFQAVAKQRYDVHFERPKP